MLALRPRAILLTLFTLLMGTSLDLRAEDKDCLGCHGQAGMTKQAPDGKEISLFVDAKKFGASIHGGNGCESCHADVDLASHPGNPVKPAACVTCHEKADASYNASHHAIAKRAGKAGAASCGDCHGKHDITPMTDPASPLLRSKVEDTCGTCHTQQMQDYKASTHGAAMAKGVHEAPTCTDCHGEHVITGLKPSQSTMAAANVCAKCHGDARFNAKFDNPANRISSFYQSYHGLAAKLGDKSAANCASCHGAHKILPSSDPESQVNQANLVKTCGKCHAGSNDKFITGKIHTDYEDTSTLGARINHWVRRIYIVLIVLTIVAMGGHNLLDWFKKIRRIYKDRGRTVLRMKLGQRIQHGCFALSFIILALTGFALKYPDSWVGAIFGANEAIRRLVHRIAAVVMMGASAYHILYVAFTREGRKVLADIFPKPQDALDALRNLLHLVRKDSPRPRFGRFTYAEKAEYWALVWGTAVMAVTGLLIWFKIFFSAWFPRWIVDIATTIHLYEAILATLAIIVWHFYFVIFDPEVYPVNLTFLDGRTTPEHYEHEHGLDEHPEVIDPKKGSEETGH